MLIRPAHLAVLITITVVAIGGAYVAERQSAIQMCEDYKYQMVSATRAIEWSVDIKTLTAVRERQTDVVFQLENWIVSGLIDLDLTKLAEGTLGRHVLAETLTSINAYRMRFPDTVIDPSKEPRLSAVLALQKK